MNEEQKEAIKESLWSAEAGAAYHHRNDSSDAAGGYEKIARRLREAFPALAKELDEEE